MTAKLAGALVGALLIAATLVQGGPVERLVEQLGSQDAAERSLAREEILSLGEGAVPSLIDATCSDDPNLRWEAVNLLGIIEDPRGIDAVLRLAISDPDVHARWRANWALCCLDDGSVVPRLLAALEDEDPLIVWNAAVALSLFRAAEAVPVLYQGLEATGFQQWEAVNSLGRVWDDTTASRLVLLLADGPQDLREEAALSLGRIGGEEAASALLLALRTDPSRDVRWRAAMGIGRIGGPDIIPTLLEIAGSEADPFVLNQIEEAIDRLNASEGG